MNKIAEKYLREAEKDATALEHFRALCQGLKGKDVNIDTDLVAKKAAGCSMDSEDWPSNFPEVVDEILFAMLEAIKNENFEEYEAIEEFGTYPGSVVGELEAELERIAGWTPKARY